MQEGINRVVKGYSNSGKVIILLLFLSLCGFFHVLCQTSQGAEVTDDSVLFVAAGQNLARGDGFSWPEGNGTPKPLTGFPPGYSFLLAPFDLLNMDLYGVARWLNAIIFGALIYIVGHFILYHTHSWFSAAAGSMLILVSKSLLDMYSWIMADGFFILIYISAVYVSIRYLAKGERALLLTTGILIGLASMLRYIGLSLFPAVALLLFFSNHFSWRRKIKDLVILCIISLLPFFILTLRNMYVAGSAYNRSFIITELKYENLVAYLNEVFSWFFPYLMNVSIRLRWQLLIVVILLLGLPVYSICQVFKQKLSIPADDRRVMTLSPSLLLSSIIFYAAALLVSVSHYGLGEDIVTRYLLPLMISTIVLEITVIYRLVFFSRHIKMLSVISALVVIGLTLYQGIELVNSIQLNEVQLSNEDFKRTYPENPNILKSIIDSREIFTNEIYLLYYLAERPSHQIPLLIYGYEGIERNDMSNQMADYRQALNDGAVLVLFNWIRWQGSTYPSEEELTEGLHKVRDIGFGAVYVDPAWQDSMLFNHAKNDD
jgi:hypothetical protein